MPAGAESVRGPSTVAATALLVLIPAWLAAPLLELTRGDRFADTDDPAAGLEFLERSAGAVVLSGIAVLLAAAALVVAASAFEVLLARQPPGATTSGIRAVSASAYIGAGLLVLAGALRISSPGPLTHLADLNPEWGRTGYLVMHLVGTQGATAGARLAIAAWMLGVVIIAVRRRLLPAWVHVLAPVPIVLLLSIVGPLLSMATAAEPVVGGAAWIVLMLVFFVGVPLWCAVLAVCLLVRARGARRRLPPD
ncbi:hypothetical protein [Agromyces subbeticus]|uniref:hypothetical protein n=1 Tax=Agromyces subbeticus TaxID=293890 RepID=UPI0003B67EBA|nr:hypothetical protein [Agromyces subbeticus]